jgi:hypothetical protein
MWKSLKRWPVLLALLIAVGTLAVGLLCLPREGRVTRENCERIKEGMTEADVRAILGKPWDDSLLDPEGPGAVVMPVLYSKEYPCIWSGSDVGILVIFYEDRRLTPAGYSARGEQSRVARTILFTYADRPRSWLPARAWRRLRARWGW